MEAGQPSTVEAATRQVAARVAPPLEHARNRLNGLNSKLTAFIKEQPGTCLLVAVGLGFVVGRIASR